MKSNCIFWLILFPAFLYGCKKAEESPTGPDDYRNLFTNSSFEFNGNPSIDGWLLESNIQSTVEFSNDVPQSGGNWSVILSVSDRIIKRLRTTVAAPVGIHRYRLSVWAKSIGDAGKVWLILNKASIRSIVVADSVWTLYQTLDTLSTSSCDSLSVELDTGVTYFYGQTYFDLCKLELLN